MEFNYSTVHGLVVHDERGTRCIANFEMAILGRNEDRFSLVFTNRHGKRVELDVDAQDLERPMSMRRHFLRKGNYHWSGGNGLLKIYMEQLLERFERV